MEKLDKYQIDLKGMQTSSSKFDFHLDNTFFADIDASDVREGKVEVSLLIKKTSHAFDLFFHTEGTVKVTCDRCLDEMNQAVVSDDTLHVRFGSAYAEEADDWVIVPEEEGRINVALFMYEFIVLAIPMKHVHAPGECNESMRSQLNKYLRTTPDEEVTEGFSIEEEEAAGENLSDKPIDPRWNELKKFLDNN